MCLFLLFPHFPIGKIWKALQMQDVAFQLFFKFLLDDIPCGSKLCSEKAPKKLRQKTYWIPMCPPLKFSILSSCWLPHKDGTFGGPTTAMTNFISRWDVVSSMSSSTMIPFDHSILNSSSWGWKLCLKSCCLERLWLYSPRVPDILQIGSGFLKSPFACCPSFMIGMQ